MYDMLPFPDFNGKTNEEKVSQIYNYLIRLKEDLEFILSNISTENLSQDLIDKLNSLGAEIEQGARDRDDQMVQVASKTLSVSDVINSAAFSLAVKSEIKDVNFTVNFDTGNLEYTT
jgi:hypothetical protein